jgi:uncharacterized membrane protein
MQSQSEKKTQWIALIVLGIITLVYNYEEVYDQLHFLAQTIDFLVLWALIIVISIYVVKELYQFIKPRDKKI